jgi:hypothetical protein
MPETTSVVLLTLLNLVNVILTSPIQVIALRSRIASWRSAFLVPNRKGLAGRNCLAKMKPSSKARHQNGKWQFARSVSRLRSPASIKHPFHCEGAWPSSARVRARGQYSAMICAGIPNLVCPVEFASPRLTTPVEIPTSVNCRTVL